MWLWYRPAAVAPIWPLAWALTSAVNAALKSKKQRNKGDSDPNQPVQFPSYWAIWAVRNWTWHALQNYDPFFEMRQIFQRFGGALKPRTSSGPPFGFPSPSPTLYLNPKVQSGRLQVGVCWCSSAICWDMGSKSSSQPFLCIPQQNPALLWPAAPASEISFSPSLPTEIHYRCGYDYLKFSRAIIPTLTHTHSLNSDNIHTFGNHACSIWIRQHPSGLEPAWNQRSSSISTHYLDLAAFFVTGVDRGGRGSGGRE